MHSTNIVVYLLTEINVNGTDHKINCPSRSLRFVISLTPCIRDARVLVGLPIQMSGA